MNQSLMPRSLREKKIKKTIEVFWKMEKDDELDFRYRL